VRGSAGAAEAAYQATSRAVAGRARRLRRPGALVGWLHGVACGVALKARPASERWRRRGPAPAQGPAAPGADPLEQVSVREWLSLLDAEVQQLPEAYRLPVLLCCLEGRPQDEVARELGWTPGAVKGRLERGKKLLRERL